MICKISLQKRKKLFWKQTHRACRQTLKLTESPWFSGLPNKSCGCRVGALAENQIANMIQSQL